LVHLDTGPALEVIPTATCQRGTSAATHHELYIAGEVVGHKGTELESRLSMDLLFFEEEIKLGFNICETIHRLSPSSRFFA